MDETALANWAKENLRISITEMFGSPNITKISLEVLVPGEVTPIYRDADEWKPVSEDYFYVGGRE